MSAPEKEGWDVPARLPLLALVGFVLTLAVAVTVLGHVYVRRLAPNTRPPEATFPAPKLELTQTPPDLGRSDYQQPPPPRIDQAMRETAGRGEAIWSGAAK